MDRAFKETSSDGGHMRFGGWHKVVRTIEANPVLQARFKKVYYMMSHYLYVMCIYIYIYIYIICIER